MFPDFGLDLQFFFLHFLILDFDLCFGACLTRNVSDNWTYSLSSHKTWRASSPLIEPLTFVKIPSTTYLPFIWEGAILRECHSPARTLADGAVITAPLNHLTLAVMAAREASKNPNAFLRSRPQRASTPSQMQEFHPWMVQCGWRVRNVGVLKAGLLKNGFECKSTLLRNAKGCSQAKVVSFIILGDPKFDMSVRQFLVSDKRV